VSPRRYSKFDTLRVSTAYIVQLVHLCRLSEKGNVDIDIAAAAAAAAETAAAASDTVEQTSCDNDDRDDLEVNQV